MLRQVKPPTKQAAKPPAKQLVKAAPAARSPNPFLDPEFYARMRGYTDRAPMIAKELKAIGERGAGKLCNDARLAPSLQAVRVVVKKGLTLADMFERIVAGTEKALWEPWMASYGFELRSVNYAPSGPRNACLALDLGVDSKAHALFAKVLVPNWRSLAAEDCARLHVASANEKSPAKASAIFYLDADADLDAGAK